MGEGARDLGADDSSGNGSDNCRYDSPSQLSSGPDDKPGSNRSAGEDQDGDSERRDQDKILAGDDGLPRNSRNLRQFLHGNLRATELATSLGTDHDIDVGAVETRAQQATDRCIE